MRGRVSTPDRAFGGIQQGSGILQKPAHKILFGNWGPDFNESLEYRPQTCSTETMDRRSTRVAIAAVLMVALVMIWMRRDRRPQLDPPAVLLRVQQLNQLATVKYVVQKVIGIREQKVPVGEESILLIVQANVEAGIDLAGMHPDDVSIRPDNTLVVRLPEPRILNIVINEKETKVWDRQKTWWTPWVPYSIDLEQRARMAGLEAVKQTALDMGILTQAERNAALSIQGLLGLAGLKSVRVVPVKT